MDGALFVADDFYCELVDGDRSQEIISPAVYKSENHLQGLVLIDSIDTGS